MRSRIKIEENSGDIQLGTLISIPLSDFPTLRSCHQKHCPSTIELESFGAMILPHLADGSATASQLIDFIDAVLDWGGISRVKGGVKRGWNSRNLQLAGKAAKGLAELEVLPNCSSESFTADEARAALAATTLAVKMFNSEFGFKGLQMASGTKIVRMLAPRFAPVYDSMVRASFGVHDGDQTFEDFSAYSLSSWALSKHLLHSGVGNPSRGNSPEWFAADIDAAIFAALRHHNNEWLDCTVLI